MTGLALRESHEVSKLRIQKHGGASHSRNEFTIVLECTRVSNFDHVQCRHDALQRRAKLMADLREKYASSGCELGHRCDPRSLFLDGSDIVDSTDERRKKHGDERHHKKEGKRQLEL